MNRDPRAWAILGLAIRDSRNRLGLTLEQLADRAADRGGSVSSRTIGDFERGRAVPKRDSKPQKLEQVVAALDWQPGFVDRILNGEDPAVVVGQQQAFQVPAVPPARQVAFELLPGVYEFARAALAAGADASLKDALEEAAESLVASIPGRAMPDRSTYELVAYSPHRVGEDVPEDDAERIQRAIDEQK